MILKFLGKYIGTRVAKTVLRTFKMELSGLLPDLKATVIRIVWNCQKEKKGNESRLRQIVKLIERNCGPRIANAVLKEKNKVEG